MKPTNTLVTFRLSFSSRLPNFPEFRVSWKFPGVTSTHLLDIRTIISAFTLSLSIMSIYFPIYIIKRYQFRYENVSVVCKTISISYPSLQPSFAPQWYVNSRKYIAIGEQCRFLTSLCVWFNSSLYHAGGGNDQASGQLLKLPGDVVELIDNTYCRKWRLPRKKKRLFEIFRLLIHIRQFPTYYLELLVTVSIKNALIFIPNHKNHWNNVCFNYRVIIFSRKMKLSALLSCWGKAVTYYVYGLF